MKSNKKQLTILIFAIVAISFAFPAFAQYTPMVRIPGLPATGAISLSQYLVGLYNFLVSIVGIVAVMMMIVGGMRYITAGGSSSAIGDAKDIISNAIAGLIIAIFAWVIVAAINPDVLYIKKPALDPTGGVSMGCVKNYVTPVTCLCNDGTNATGPKATAAECDNSCQVERRCGGMSIGCIQPNSVNDTIGPKFNVYPNNGKCLCVDGADILPGAFTTCQAACAPNNCLVADAKIGIDHNIPGMTIEESAKKFSTNDAPKKDPIVVPHNSRLIIYGGNSVSNNPVNWWKFDIDADHGDGTYSLMLPGGAQPWSWYVADYNWHLGKPECVTSVTPDSVTCAIWFEVEDNVGNKSIDKVYVRILKP